ncbi:type IX secretion system plug protein [Rhodohalobacter sp. 8-1]|uniref:type IX secretion system plug protein n=1 Tax=Rhodohalobacter sp. 8-1 TaxID=3131972 RepID=UPI0030ECBA98
MAISTSKQFLFLLFASLALLQCGTSRNSSSSETNNKKSYTPLENQFTVPGQVNASDIVYSVKLHRSGNNLSAPIIQLNSSQKLRLSFDLLEFESRQLSISFTHHNPDWSRSSLAEDFYKEGYFNLMLPFGRVSRTERPDYRNYQYEFPNENIEFLVSGNYMLQVEDADSGNLLFSMPFFVSENQGGIISQVETVIVPREEGRVSHNPESIFETPEFIATPQFDLEFYYVQNQFWGRAKEAGELDTSTPGEVRFEVTRNNSFVGDYEFQLLSLTDLTQQDPQILEYDPSEIPPRVVLFEDVQGFTANRNQTPLSNLSGANTSLSARYGNVHFRFDTDRQLNNDSDIYLVGDFTNWSLRSDYRLKYHQDTDRWRTNGIIKTGTYAYKYVVVQNNEIKDLALDDSFTRSRQEYHALVYYRDPDRFYYRLLQTNNFFKNN